MHSTGLAVWTVACAVMGALMAAIVPTIGSMLDSVGAREMFERLGGVGALQETLVAAFVSIGAVVISCFAVAVVSHGGGEEHDGRTEEVLATATERSATFLAVLVVALVGAAWLLLVTGLSMGVGATGSEVSFGGTFEAALVQFPAVAVVAGLSLLALAQGSRYAVLGWGFVVAFFLVGPVAEMLELPGWVAGLAPYSHVPEVPAESLDWTPELTLTAIAAALVAAAWWRYRTRDIG
jgi:ABC-2 type transport system permease protein